MAGLYAIEKIAMMLRASDPDRIEKVGYHVNLNLMSVDFRIKLRDNPLFLYTEGQVAPNKLQISVDQYTLETSKSIHYVAQKLIKNLQNAIDEVWLIKVPVPTHKINILNPEMSLSELSAETFKTNIMTVAAYRKMKHMQMAAEFKGASDAYIHAQNGLAFNYGTKAQQEVAKAMQAQNTFESVMPSTFKEMYADFGSPFDSYLDKHNESHDKAIENYSVAYASLMKLASAGVISPEQTEQQVKLLSKSLEDAIGTSKSQLYLSKKATTGKYSTFKIANPPLTQQPHSKSLTVAVPRAMSEAFPGLQEVVNCPCDCLGTATIYYLIQHLNDTHEEWTRERIADWLETLDVKLEMKQDV